MFNGCASLTNINLSNFNTQKLNDMSLIFYGCKSLINVSLSDFNNQNVINTKIYIHWMQVFENIAFIKF